LKKSWIKISLGILAAGTLIGISFAAYVVKSEGMEGLFKRKREAVQKIAPEAMPILDTVEESVMGEKAGK